MRITTSAAIACVFWLSWGPVRPTLAEPIRLAEDPAVSPNGKQIAFAYDGDVWIAPIAGGRARQVTFDPARDSNPQFSPDGKRLALVSDRRGAAHAYVLSLAKGVPRQVTFHSEGCRIHGWYPDGRGLLVSGRRDLHWRHAERFWRVDLERPGAERPLFDAYGADGCLARDAQRLLFVREGERWWRQGYTGARSAQIWRYDLKDDAFTKMVDLDGDCRWPLWRPDYRGFYYVGGDHDGYDLWSQNVDPKTKAPSGEPRKLADMGHGSIVFPALSRNGKALVYRHLGDLYRINPTAPDPTPKKIELHRGGDPQTARTIRRTLAKAEEIDFSGDALEIAVIAGGDVWVMDTVLREPIPVTRTPQDESDVLFGRQQKKLYMVRETDDGQRDIWVAERADDGKFWWQNREFKFQQLTDDPQVQRRLKLSKGGELLFYVQGRGELWVRNTSGDPKPRKLVSGFDAPDYDVSADGKWVAYSHSDDDFNRDVWIVPVDGSREPYNLSRHPDDDSRPRWSPDGKLLAFTGKRASDDETDIHYVWLNASDEDLSSRDRKLQSALTKMKSRKRPPRKAATRDIDFDGLQDRLHRVSIANVNENSLIWSADSKRLGFRGEVNAVKGIYAITIPGSSKPALVTSNDGVPIAWKSSGTLLMAINGVPASVNSKGEKTTYSLSAKQEYDRAARFGAAFDVCWRTMRDNWYDENLGNRNWDEVRRRYRPLAEAAPDRLALRTVVELMLGELNGSHLGFYPSIASSSSSSWKEVTPHLGVRFDPDFRGPGLKIRDVIPDGPADESDSRLKPGEVVLEIDGQAVDPDLNLPQLINGVLERDIRLKVKNGRKDELLPPLEGDEKPGDAGTRIVSIRPISYAVVRISLYSKWLEDNRQHVEQRSQAELGYVHIRAMDLNSFVEFERQLYYVGYGKDGLVIDVRENGGGFTTDLLLTALTQPQHAITVPRGGGQGYPQSRMVYATWNKPIIVLCNQNSYSNAEIFSHAIKHLGRGKLVGVPTAGGVISTGSVSVLDVGRLRFPFRGWFLAGTGEDMELHGAVPDVVIWPRPGELPRGVDRQLDRAIDLLRKDVKQWRQRKQPKLRRATQR